jgi:hypothetical protein
MSLNGWKAARPRRNRRRNRHRRSGDNAVPNRGGVFFRVDGRIAITAGQREAKAAKLKEILAAVDKSIADGSLTAEQVALLENKIHAAAQRLGAV